MKAREGLLCRSENLVLKDGGRSFCGECLVCTASS